MAEKSPPTGAAEELLRPDKRYDAVVIGGGHNGLVCACYLAGAGLTVGVLERRGVARGELRGRPLRVGKRRPDGE